MYHLCYTARILEYLKCQSNHCKLSVIKFTILRAFQQVFRYRPNDFPLLENINGLNRANLNCRLRPIEHQNCLSFLFFSFFFFFFFFFSYFSFHFQNDIVNPTTTLRDG